MLLENIIKPGDIITLKLSTGEEIIATFSEENKDYIKVGKPLALVNGGRSLGMIPWIFLGESDSVKISRSFVVAGPMLTKKDAAQQYMEGTTGIAII